MAEFTHELFGKLRTVEIDGGVWFSLLDVSNSLEYSRVSDAKKNLSDSQYKTADSRVKADLGFSKGRPPIVINESGLYQLVMRSDKPEAKKFQLWITDEVLPSLRSKGTYSMQEDDAPAWARELMAKVDVLAEKAAERDFHLETSQGYSLADVARMVGLPPREFNEELVLGGLLTRADSGHLVATPEFADLGLFVSRKGPVTVVTPEGLDALLKKFTTTK